MFALSGAKREMIGQLKRDIEDMGLIGTDMETSALLVAARILGARASTLCVATVDAHTQDKISDAQMSTAETELFEVALTAITAVPA
jgi:uridine phosphorylase